MTETIDTTKLIRIESEYNSCVGCDLRVIPACATFLLQNNFKSCIEYKVIHGVESDFIHRYYIYKLKDETNSETL